MVSSGSAAISPSTSLGDQKRPNPESCGSTAADEHCILVVSVIYFGFIVRGGGRHMTFVESIRTCFSKYVTWEGRAARSEYWYFILFAVLCYLVAAVIDNVLGTTFKIANPSTGVEQSVGYGYAYVLVALGLLLPSLSVLVRRLHDTDRSGGDLVLVWTNNLCHIMAHEDRQHHRRSPLPH